MTAVDSFSGRHPIACRVAAGLSVFSVVAGAITLYKSYDSVPTGSYGIRDYLGQVDATKLTPGLYWKKPWRESIWSFNNNVVRREIKVGSGFDSNSSSSSSSSNGSNDFELSDLITRDRNPFAIDLRIHYKIDPEAGLLSLHLRDMSNDDGIKLLSTLADNSTKWLAGQQDVSALLNDPVDFLKSFGGDFSMRLAQNNVPARICMIEMLGINVGGMRKVVALRWRPDGTIDTSAGPAAVPVPLAPGRPPEAGATAGQAASLLSVCP